MTSEDNDITITKFVLKHDKNMPLGKNVSKNIKELYKDNKKSGKAKGANGKPRSKAQIVAVAYSASKKRK